MAFVSALLAVLFATTITANAAVTDGMPASLENANNVELLNAVGNSQSAFLVFLNAHGKNYTGTEFLHRLRVFETNVLKAIENQLNDPSAVHGITQFSDLTEEEFGTRYLGLKMSPEGFGDHPQAPVLPTDQLPTDFDWREKGAVTPVKNQGVCGSCYAFSAVGALEGAHFLATGELVSLSEQQVVDCDAECDPTYYDVCDSGCQGGLMNNAINYMMKAGGLVKEEEYPYKGVDGTCKVMAANDMAADVGSYLVVSAEEQQIEANLIKYGPLAVAINAAWMQTYIKGVSCPLVCNKLALDHGVLLVGYGASELAISRLKKLPFWIIKNSWGASWGEEGYYKICSGKNMCGVQSMVSSVVATKLKLAGGEGKVATA